MKWPVSAGKALSAQGSTTPRASEQNAGKKSLVTLEDRRGREEGRDFVIFFL